ncbi:MAG: FAD-dependent oxidoreductase [Thermoleophilia bacterium]
MRRTDVLIVGAGLAGARCAEALRAYGFAGDILLAGDEPFPPYERPALSKTVITDGHDLADVALRPDDAWASRGIDLRTAAEVISVDLDARTAVAGDEPVAWRRLVVATGARARRLPGTPPVDGVHHLRTLADARELRRRLGPGTRMVLIGAGFVGAELASSARGLGTEVHVVEVEELPLGRVLGPEAGARVADRMRMAGVHLHMGAMVEEIVAGAGRVRAVRLRGGGEIPCDEVVVGIGAVPNTELLGGRLPLAMDGGIVTDEAGRTEVDGVFACGDVASLWRRDIGRHARLEHWSAAAESARAVAAAIAGADIPSPGIPYVWSDQFGWRLQMVGHPTGESVIDDEPDGFTVRYLGDGGAVVGGLAVNRPQDVPLLRAEIAAGVAVTAG